MPFSFGDEPVFAGQSVQVTCFVIEGDFPLQIEWEFNGTKAFDDLGVITSNVGKKTSLLNIESVDSEHAGTYSCVAKNRAGQVRQSSSLDINGKISIGTIPFFACSKVTEFRTLYRFLNLSCSLPLPILFLAIFS